MEPFRSEGQVRQTGPLCAALAIDFLGHLLMFRMAQLAPNRC